MQLHNNLFIEGEVCPRYKVKPEEAAQGKKAPYTFRIKKISLLGNINEQYLADFTLKIDSSVLNPGFRKELLKLIKSNKGPTRLCIKLFDTQTGYVVDFKSKKYQICASADFIDSVRRLGIQFNVGKKPFV